jgi:hypothetical protein
VQGFLRPGIGYLFQSLAFLINVHRWEKILGGAKNGTAVTMGKRESVKIVAPTKERKEGVDGYEQV